MKKFFITATSDLRVRELLSSNLPRGTNIENVLDAGGIWLKKKRVHDGETIVPSGETIKVHISTFQDKTYFLDIKKGIIFENNDFLVIYKPPDLNVHQVPSSFYYNLTYGVNQYLKESKIHFESTPLTRLDRPVEGLVIFSKNKDYERRLFDLIKRRKIKKWYMCATEKTNHPRYTRVIDRISNDGNRTYLDTNGKDADSLFIKTNSTERIDIYSVFIFTGRRHQIRFHASQYISPIIGDWFYGSSRFLIHDEIALMCRGYNIPYKKTNLRIRIPESFIKNFFERITRYRHK